MSRYSFKLAGAEDDADLRSVLARTPMPGRIALTFQREPSFFESAAVDGHFRQVVTACEGATGKVVGFGCRSIGPRFVNGHREAIGYLSSLRLLEEHRKRGLVARGYACLRRLHRDGRTRLYLTTIAEGNDLALKLLVSRRAGLPAHHFAGRYHTAAIPLGRRPGRRNGSGGIEVRPARPEDLHTVASWLADVGPQRQFFPAYTRQDLDPARGVFRDLSCGQLLLAFRGGRLAGTLGGWDQHGFRQTVVNRYGPALRCARPIYNAWARWRGRPGLPAPGQELRYLTAALPVTADDDPHVFAALLESMCERSAHGPWSHLALGLHEKDPLLPALQHFRPVLYTTRLYLVCWDGAGEELRSRLDGRVPYMELGCL